MKRALKLVACTLVGIAVSSGWGQQSSYDPSAKQQGKPSEGFVDFALKQINPQNIDYGCELDEARKFAVAQTIKRIDTWAVFAALAFLVLAFIMLLHQNQERKRRELIAAEFLAQYHNSWVDARTHAADATRRYNELVDTANRTAEASLTSTSGDAHGPQTMVVKADLGRDATTRSVTGTASSVGIRADDDGANRSDSSQGIKTSVQQNREPDVDLMAQILTLQQQLTASHEREKNLQKELARAQRRVPAAEPKDTNPPA